ncbi:hypothetical protein N7510_009461 [Penicillium lagena]|uniref:uncharacterized protein n=1 Tax=Penicillium lagena TaxID=94218 RepID=UPI0025425E61|nr:uncharacterized protein N7510_009461 [Penicillium lagena]KAJ5606680.1 hypothetical protein N7510_009461 [Penicillium lagena]
MAIEDLVSSETFHVAIIGGGIGGLAVALSIAKYSPTLAKITVYEQAPEYGEIGAGVGIGIQAGRVLRNLGVYEAVDAISGHRNGCHRSTRRYDNDDIIVDVLAANSDGLADGIGQLWVHRADFLEVLYNEIRKRGCAKLETGKKAVKLEDCGSTVSIIFEDGSSSLAHLVIACDGIHSTIRSQFAVDRPTYSGRIAYRGTLPFAGTELAESWPYPSLTVSWLAPDKHFLVFPISKGRLLNVVGFVTKHEDELDGLKESWKSAAPREDLEQEYAGWTPKVQKIIRSMSPVVSKWKLNDRELLSDWCYMDGKVVLSGDAAHAMLPHQGSGAGHAIEDANVLGLAIRDFLRNPSASLSTYMALYQAVRLPRAQKAQITSRQAGDVYEFQGPDFKGLSFEECIPVAAEKLKDRMAWVWSGDLDKDYVAAKAKAGME